MAIQFPTQAFIQSKTATRGRSKTAETVTGLTKGLQQGLDLSDRFTQIAARRKRMIEIANLMQSPAFQALPAVQRDLIGIAAKSSPGTVASIIPSLIKSQQDKPKKGGITQRQKIIGLNQRISETIKSFTDPFTKEVEFEKIPQEQKDFVVKLMEQRNVLQGLGQDEGIPQQLLEQEQTPLQPLQPTETAKQGTLQKLRKKFKILDIQ